MSQIFLKKIYINISTTVLWHDLASANIWTYLFNTTWTPDVNIWRCGWFDLFIQFMRSFKSINLFFLFALFLSWKKKMVKLGNVSIGLYDYPHWGMPIKISRKRNFLIIIILYTRLYLKNSGNIFFFQNVIIRYYASISCLEFHQNRQTLSHWTLAEISLQYLVFPLCGRFFILILLLDWVELISDLDFD